MSIQRHCIVKGREAGERRGSPHRSSEKEAEIVEETSDITSSLLCTEHHDMQELESSCIPMV